ncbi:alpha/beta hydrolase [Luteimonas vadosa]|uniref:Alpha/beta hydrolase n=1 Tax=Luteimonas vadosa TaxID=1165507 RepID=A0ABP9E7X0_9GAMM
MKQTSNRTLTALLVATAALLTAGCERVIFGVANRGTLPPTARVVYAEDTGLSLDVYRPRDASTAAPVVVFFYGGSWKRGSRDQYRFVGSRLAEHGVLAIVADYRTFPRAGFPAFMDDAAAAVAWAKRNAAGHGGDPGRLFIAGHSAGAQIAGLLGTDKSYLRRAGVAIGDIAGVIGLAGPYDFNVGTEYAPIFGPPRQWPKAQAVNYVDGDEPPFLLVHGGKDRIVEARDSIDLDRKLRAKGGESTLLLLPDAGHFAPIAGFYEPARAPGVVAAVLRFVGAAPGGPAGAAP